MTDTEHAHRVPTPGDPDGQNHERAGQAAEALAAFNAAVGTEEPDALAHLLCNLMHLSGRDGLDFAAALERARVDHEAETVGRCDA